MGREVEKRGRGVDIEELENGEMNVKDYDSSKME